MPAVATLGAGQQGGVAESLVEAICHGSRDLHGSWCCREWARELQFLALPFSWFATQ